MKLKILTAAGITAVVLSSCTEAAEIGVTEQGLLNKTVSDNLSECETSENKNDWIILVNDTHIALNGHYPYKENDAVMIPICEVSEALGYQVSPHTGDSAFTIDDKYIQKAVLTNGSDLVAFEGNLKVINMSREIKLSVPITVKDDCVYAPAEFFTEFFNDVTVYENSIIIAPSKSKLD